MPGHERTGLKGTYLCALTENEVERIHDGALQILAQTGIVVQDDGALTLLDEAGCQVNHKDRHVHIPAQVIEEAVAKAPPVVTLYNRLGEQAMALGAGPLHARTSSGAHIEVGGALRKGRVQRRSSVALSSGAYRRVGAKRRIETKRVVCRAARLISIRFATQSALAPPSFAYTPSSGAMGILDLDSGRRREPTGQDLAHATRLADALPHIHGVSTMAVQPADVSATTVDVHTVRLALANTIKPLGYVCLNEQLLEPVLAMVAVVFGGDEIVKEVETQARRTQ